MARSWAPETTGERVIAIEKSRQQDLRIEEHGGGFLVEDPVLSLDLNDVASFNFFSSVRELLLAPANRGPKRQALLSEEAFNVLKWRGLSGSFLPCPYFRPISLGCLNVELLPSGEGCGASFLHISKGNGEATALYVHRWSLFGSRALRAAAPKPASDLLLKLWANPLEASHTQDRKELSRFFDFVTKITKAGEWIVAIAPALGPSHIILNEMHSRGVPTYLDATSHRVLKSQKLEANPDDAPSWEHAPRKLGARIGQDEPGLIILSPDSLRLARWPALPRAIWCAFEDPADPSSSMPSILAAAGIGITETFGVQFAPDMGDIQSLVEAVKPLNVTITGPGSEAVAASLSRIGVRSKTIQPVMLTLF